MDVNKRIFCSKSLIDVIWLLLIAGLLLLWRLGDLPLHMPDEARYSQIAHEMFKANDWITPTVNGVVFLDKPILFYWLQMLSFKLLGVNEFAARLPSALLAIGSLLAIYFAAFYLFGRYVARLASAILLTMPLFFAASHYANMDMSVSGFLTLALSCFIIGQYKQKSLMPLMGFYLFMALALLTKGLIAIAFPVAIIVFWSVAIRKLPKLHIMPGFILLFSIILPWFLLIGSRIDGFYYYFFMVQHFYRYLSHSMNNQQPFWFYFAVVGLGTLPWSLFALSNWRGWKNFISPKASFFLIWFVFILAFFSIPQSKPLGYILPVLPPFAIMLALLIDKEARASRLLLKLLAWLGLLIGFTLGIVAFKYKLAVPNSSLVISALASMFLICSIISLCYLRKTVLVPSLSLFFVVLVFSLLAAAYLLKPVLTRSNLPLVNMLKQHLKPADKVVMYYDIPFDVLFYLSKRPIYAVDDWLEGLYYGDVSVHQLALGLAHYHPTHFIYPKQFMQMRNSHKGCIYVFTSEAGYQHIKGKFTLLKKQGAIHLLSDCR